MKGALKKQLDQIEEFSVSQEFFGSGGQTGIAIDNQQKSICLLSKNEAAQIFLGKDILSCEIFEDEITVTNTKRSSQISAALLGGLVFGGVGAIIGGLSGKTQTSGKVTKMGIRLIVNDAINPVREIILLSSETKKGGMLYNLAIRVARLWHGMIKVLIWQADLDDEQAQG